MPRAIIQIDDDPVTQSVNVTCVTDITFDPRHPSHAIARYIGLHLGEIMEATKAARASGEMNGVANQADGSHVEGKTFEDAPNLHDDVDLQAPKAANDPLLGG